MRRPADEWRISDWGSDLCSSVLAGAFAYPAGLADRGDQLWTSDPAIRARFPDLAALTRATPAALAAVIGAKKAEAITAFLRRNPHAVIADRKSTRLNSSH